MPQLPQTRAGDFPIGTHSAQAEDSKGPPGGFNRVAGFSQPDEISLFIKRWNSPKSTSFLSLFPWFAIECRRSQTGDRRPKALSHYLSTAAASVWLQSRTTNVCSSTERRRSKELRS